MESRPSSMAAKPMLNFEFRSDQCRYDLSLACVTLKYSAQSEWISNLKAYFAAGNPSPDTAMMDSPHTEESARSAGMYKMFFQADDSAIDYLPEQRGGADKGSRVIVDIVRLSMNAHIVDGAPVQRYKLSAKEIFIKIANSRVPYAPHSEDLFVQVQVPSPTYACPGTLVSTHPLMSVSHA